MLKQWLQLQWLQSAGPMNSVLLSQMIDHTTYQLYTDTRTIHPVSVTRFPSFRTQPLENLSVDSVNKWIPEQPSPWRKS